MACLNMAEWKILQWVNINTSPEMMMLCASCQNVPPWFRVLALGSLKVVSRFTHPSSYRSGITVNHVSNYVHQLNAIVCGAPGLVDFLPFYDHHMKKNHHIFIIRSQMILWYYHHITITLPSYAPITIILPSYAPIILPLKLSIFWYHWHPMTIFWPRATKNPAHFPTLAARCLDSGLRGWTSHDQGAV